MSIDINYLGFGFVDRAVMENTDLDIYAKAVYAYLCVYRDKKTETAFPSVRRLCADLNICRSTAMKAIASLRKNEIISTRFRAYWGYKYTIPRQAAKGYGAVPKTVMLDRRISAKSKALYALLVAYAGNKGSAFPRTATICRQLKIGRSSYTKYMQELVRGSYIVRKQQKEQGKFSVNIYLLATKVPKQAVVGHTACVQLIKSLCSEYGLSPAPIKYFAERINRVSKKYGASYIKNMAAYVKALIKSYMSSKNIPIASAAMTETERLRQRQALLRWQLENIDILQKEAAL